VHQQPRRPGIQVVGRSGRRGQVRARGCATISGCCCCCCCCCLLVPQAHDRDAGAHGQAQVQLTPRIKVQPVRGTRTRTHTHTHAHTHTHTHTHTHAHARTRRAALRHKCPNTPSSTRVASAAWLPSAAARAPQAVVGAPPLQLQQVALVEAVRWLLEPVPADRPRQRQRQRRGHAVVVHHERLRAATRVVWYTRRGGGGALRCSTTEQLGQGARQWRMQRPPLFNSTRTLNDG
jgi:hypothetical protein